MIRQNAEKLSYETAEVLGKPALFTDLRIDRRSVPAGLHLYEIRHSDDDWGEPCQLARGILVNFYGSVLVNEAYQLPPSGKIDLSEEHFAYTDEPPNTIPEYLKKYPPVKTDVIDFFTAEPAEIRFLYSRSEQDDRACGCIGHLRGDFDSGKSFFTTWWPHQDDALNTPEFKKDIDRVVNWLRQEDSPLKDFDTMQRFCRIYESYARIPQTSLPEYGYSIRTAHYRYMLRCRPIRGDYHFYLYCYERPALEKVLAQPKKERGGEAR